jgi:signal transduction histidine kinase
MGLLGMEERVRQLGGKLEVQSQPGKGTTLHISLPVPSSA